MHALSTKLPAVFKSLLLCCLFLSLSACAGVHARDEAGPKAPSRQCDRLYTYAPGFLMIDVTAGSDVILMPKTRQFAVFCSVKEAKDHLRSKILSHEVPNGDWGIYALNGGTELTMETPDGALVLAKDAKLSEWIEKPDFASR